MARPPSEEIEQGCMAAWANLWFRRRDWVRWPTRRATAP